MSKKVKYWKWNTFKQKAKVLKEHHKAHVTEYWKALWAEEKKEKEKEEQENDRGRLTD